MKMKLNISFESIAAIFGLSSVTVSRWFKETLPVMAEVSKLGVTWLPKEAIRQRTPPIFKELCPGCRCIIDCTEIFIGDIHLLIIMIMYFMHVYHRTISWYFLKQDTCANSKLVTKLGMGRRPKLSLLQQCVKFFHTFGISKKYYILLIPSWFWIFQECVYFSKLILNW